ncbi:MAG: M20/M25/M40 family metallo-hydrolase [Candidatus Fermentibacter sp.]|nr:M20/M25/M40 family metallo-hydrolase [Candidatus Fermentibacter sp.]
MRIYVIALLVTQAVSADTAMQTDWSGGMQSSTVTSWTNTFLGACGMNFISAPGEVGISPVTYLSSNFTGSPHPSGGLADIDGNGYPDAVIMSTNAPVRWFRNLSSPEGFSYGSTCGAKSRLSGLADMDGDGDTDLVTGNLDDELELSRNSDGSGMNWQKSTIVPDLFPSLSGVLPADIDADGDADVVACNYAPGLVMACLNTDGEGGSWNPVDVCVGVIGFRNPRASDVDGDGSIDLVCVNYLQDRICWWDNVGGSGTGWQLHEIPFPIKSPRCCDAGDVDGDGDMDILVAATGGASVLLLENNDGSGLSWSETAICTSLPMPSFVRISDVDGDPFFDALVSCMSTGTILWLERTGQVWTSQELLTGFYGASCLDVSDIDGDGIADFLATSETQEFAIVGSCASPSPLEESYLTSRVLDTQCQAEWGSVSWTAEVPSGAFLAVQLRASNDPEEMGSWSEPFIAPGEIGGAVPDGCRYVQYRFCMTSDQPGIQPVMEEISDMKSPGCVRPGGRRLLLYFPQSLPRVLQADIHRYPGHRGRGSEDPGHLRQGGQRRARAVRGGRPDQDDRDGTSGDLSAPDLAPRRQHPQQQAGDTVNRILPALIVALLSSAVEGLEWDPAVAALVDAVDEEQFKAAVQDLEDFGTRFSEAPGYLEACQHVEAVLESYGYAAYLQEFQLQDSDPRLSCWNVIGEYPGQFDPEQILIVCAHLDSDSDLPLAYAPGADDDASGCAAVLEVARVLSQTGFEKTIRFVFYGAEELGHQGSEYYAQQCLQAGDQIVGVIDLDMVLYSPLWLEDTLLIGADSSFCNGLAATVVDCASNYVPDMELLKVTYMCGSSDHSSFTELGYPAVLLIEKETSIYIHSFEDVLLNYMPYFPFGTNAVRLAAGSVATLAVPLPQGIGDGQLPPDGVIHISPSENPFDGPVLLSVSGVPAPALFEIYDTSGRLVRRIATAEGGSCCWDGRDSGGRDVPDGAYIVRVLAGGLSGSCRIVRLD